MELFHKIFKSLLGNPEVAIPISPCTFADIIKQFDQPKKEKTSIQVFQDYFYKESMANLEVEMLKLDPYIIFKGYQTWIDNQGVKFCDWVPCVLSPEIYYCCYGKN